MSLSSDTFTGGIAVITGAGSGIGAGLARHAAAAGMRVVLADIATERIGKVADEIRKTGGSALPITTDVTNADDLNALAEKTWQAFGDVRLLINNAGMESVGNLWDIPTSTWEKVVNLNILGVVHGVRAFLPRMLAAGKPASIANLSSVGGLNIMAMQTPYIMSKHAVQAFTECLAIELKLMNAPISVSAVLPGPVSTRIFQDAPKNADIEQSAPQRAIMEAMLRDRGLAPDEAAKLILEGIAQGKFWVSCHPEMMAKFAAQRAANLAVLADPEPTRQMRQFAAR